MDGIFRGLIGLAFAGLLAAAAGCGHTVIIEGGGNENRPGGGIVVGPPVCGDELHIVGVYETHGDHNFDFHPPGAATVHVDRKSSSILVLSSYEPVHWTVTASDGAVLERVIL